MAIGPKRAAYRRGARPPGSQTETERLRSWALLRCWTLAMARYLPLVVFLVSIGALNAVIKEPDVQVYSRHPVEAGKKNTLNCYVEGFHPPKIDITLLKDNVPMEDVKKSDLSFGTDWTFQLLVSKDITPDGVSEYACKVVHESLAQPKVIKWDQE